MAEILLAFELDIDEVSFEDIASPTTKVTKVRVTLSLPAAAQISAEYRELLKEGKVV